MKTFFINSIFGSKKHYFLGETMDLQKLTGYLRKAIQKYNMIEEGDKSIPDDLWECMLLAYEKDCEWLCLEYCGEEVEDLPVYDW